MIGGSTPTEVGRPQVGRPSDGGPDSSGNREAEEQRSGGAEVTRRWGDRGTKEIETRLDINRKER